MQFYAMGEQTPDTGVNLICRNILVANLFKLFKIAATF